MNAKLSREFITNTLADSVLDNRTQNLYELCFMERLHFRDEVVADKLRMILKLCAERGLEVHDISPELAAYRLGKSSVDRWFAGLATAEQIDPALLFEIHKRVMDVFDDISESQARSLAAKYLHFHFPELFYLYDSQVEEAAMQLGQGECGFLAGEVHDLHYARFFACCRLLTDRLVSMAGRRLNPRELDRVLRAWVRQDPDMTSSDRSDASPSLHA